MTHNDLIEFAVRKLKQVYPVVITELASEAGEEPDAIGFNGHHSTVIECKASRSDFLADQKKRHRRLNYEAMGCYRYYMVPHDLQMHMHELPHGWGLYAVKNKRIYKRVDSKYFNNRALKNEQRLLLSVIRRIGNLAPKCISIRLYTHQTKCKASASIEVDE